MRSHEKFHSFGLRNSEHGNLLLTFLVLSVSIHDIEKWTPIPTGQDIMSINTSIYTLCSICCSSIYVGMKWHEDVWSNGDLKWSHSSGCFDVNWTDQPIETGMQIWAISIYQPQELRKMKPLNQQRLGKMIGSESPKQRAWELLPWHPRGAGTPLQYHFAVFTSKSFLHRKNVHLGNWNPIIIIIINKYIYI